MTDTTPETMNFEKFRDAVGKSDYAVRIALAVLRLKPDVQGRRVFYRREWIELVRQQIEQPDR